MKTILFQGDSITDAGRDYSNYDSLGGGYVNEIAKLYRKANKEGAYRIINRGISGNRVVDLTARWDRDCLLLKPDILCIMIGINDCWRRFDSNGGTSTEAFESGYRALLQSAKDSGVEELILIEPFVIHYPQDRASWREDLNPKIDAVRVLAREFGAKLLALDGLVQEACVGEVDGYYSGDGVHPNEEGARMIAKLWMERFGDLI